MIILKTTNEQLEILIKIHFPGCKNETNEESEPENLSVRSMNLSELMVFMTYDGK